MQVSVEVRVTSHNSELFVEEVADRVISVTEASLQRQLPWLRLKAKLKRKLLKLRSGVNANIAGKATRRELPF